MAETGQWKLCWKRDCFWCSLMKPVFETEKISQSYKSPGSKWRVGKSSAGSMLRYCFNRNILDNVGSMLQKKVWSSNQSYLKKHCWTWMSGNPAMNKLETINQCTSQHLSAESIRQSPLTPDSTKKIIAENSSWCWMHCALQHWKCMLCWMLCSNSHKALCFAAQKWVEHLKVASFFRVAHTRVAPTRAGAGRC